MADVAAKQKAPETLTRRELEREVVELRADNAELRAALGKSIAQVEQLMRRIVALEEKLRQTSRNSSKPPSSDPPGTPPRTRNKKGKRKRGGQPGHKGKTRDLLPPEEVDEVVDCRPDACDACGLPLSGDDPAPMRHQTTELLEIVTAVTEFRIHGLDCPCGVTTYGELPPGAEFAFGPRLEAVVALLTGAYRLSKRNVQALMQDVFGVDIALGSVPNIEERMSQALEQPVEEAKEHVQSQTADPIHMDETGFRVENRRAWLWTAIAGAVAVFVVRHSRGSKVVKELLGEEFSGRLVTDRWSAYNWIEKARRQLCWAHLTRDFQKLADSGGKGAGLGDALLEETDKLFTWWHRIRDGTLSWSTFRRYAGGVRSEMTRLLRIGTHTSTDPRCVRFCEELLKLWDAAWTFTRVQGVEPTNNSAERILRHAVIWRKTSFGTQSVRGTEYVERMLTTVGTLRLQGRNVLEYLVAARVAAIHGRATPSLLPTSRRRRRAA